MFLKGGVGGHGRIYIIYIRAREKGEKVLSHCFTYHIPLKDTPPLPIPPLLGENNSNDEEELR